MRGLNRADRLIVLDATEADHAAIAALHADSFARGWDEAEIARLAAADTTVALVARRTGAAARPPLGFALIQQTAFEAEVLSIAVAKRARSKGVGGLLMREVIRRLQRDRVAELFLEVDAGNAAALTLYRKLGFVQTGTRKGYYAGGEGNALIMRLEL